MKKIIFIMLLIITFTLPSDAKEKNYVDDIFKEAEVSYSWFSGLCLHKIIDGITSMDKLRSHLLSLFSPEIVENLLSSEIDGNKYFIEKDGDLYYTLDAIGLNDYTIGERKLTIKEESDTNIICELEYKAVDDGVIYKTEYIEYLIEKNDSDNFVFTSFTLPASKWTYYEPNTQTGDTTNMIGLIIIATVVAVVLKTKSKQIRTCNGMER